MATEALGDALEILKPILGEAETGATANVLIGTVKGDLHDIGKHLVAMMLENAGMKVDDLGAGVSAENFIPEIKKQTQQLSVFQHLSLPSCR
jgi:5-methyltetrahydrofolate--homocysteine methyltransferase